MRDAIRTIAAFGAIFLLTVALWGQGAFQNPPEIGHKNGHVKAVMQLSDGKRAVPNGDSQIITKIRQSII